MKKLIALTLLFITILSYGYDTHEEIDSLTVNDVLFQLLRNAYPTCKYSLQVDSPAGFEFLINVSGTQECAATLPTLETKLAELKVIAHKELTDRIELQTKKQEAKTLYLGLRSHYHQAAKKANLPHISNPDAWVRDNCERVNTIKAIDSCIAKLNQVNVKVSEVIAEITAEESKKNECNINVTAVQNFNVDTIDGMNTAQLKNLIKNMAKIIKCRIK